MKRRVRILETAILDMKEIYQLIELESPVAANKIYNEIETLIDDLETFPLKGKILDKDNFPIKNFRYLIAKPYLIFYKNFQDEVIIYRIIDGRRDYLKVLLK